MSKLLDQEMAEIIRDLQATVRDLIEDAEDDTRFMGWDDSAQAADKALMNRAEAALARYEARKEAEGDKPQTREDVYREALEDIAAAGSAHAMKDGDILQGCRDIAREALRNG